MRARDGESTRTTAGARTPSIRSAAVVDVTPLVQRAVAVQREVTDDKDFAAAAGDPTRRREAIAYLGTHPDAAKNAKLDLGTVEALLPLVGPTEHTARGALAERGFAVTTKESPNWEKASGFILILDDPGVARNLSLLSETEAKLLGKGARLAGRGTDERLMTPIRLKIRRGPGQLFGTVTVDVSAIRHGKYNRYSANESFQAQARITFTPDPDICEASAIAFVQTVSMLTNKGADSVDNREGVDKRLNSKNQAVDRQEKMKYGYFGQGNDQAFTMTDQGGVTPGVSSGGTVSPAVLLDKPDGKTEDVTYNYEAAIVAKEGTDKGIVYASVLWSFLVDEQMKVHPNEYLIRQTPTADFGTAVTAWNKQVGDKSGPSGQQALPVQRLAVTAEQSPPSRPEKGVHLVDPAARARWAATLQRSVGNRVACQLMGADNADAVQRQESPPRTAEHDEAFAKIPGSPM